MGAQATAPHKSISSPDVWIGISHEGFQGKSAISCLKGRQRPNDSSCECPWVTVTECFLMARAPLAGPRPDPLLLAILYSLPRSRQRTGDSFGVASHPWATVTLYFLKGLVNENGKFQSQLEQITELSDARSAEAARLKDAVARCRKEIEAKDLEIELRKSLRTSNYISNHKTSDIPTVYDNPLHVTKSHETIGLRMTVIRDKSRCNDPSHRVECIAANYLCSVLDRAQNPIYIAFCDAPLNVAIGYSRPEAGVVLHPRSLNVASATHTSVKIPGLKCELAAAYKESELVKQRSRSLEEELAAARACSAELAEKFGQRNGYYRILVFHAIKLVIGIAVKSNLNPYLKSRKSIDQPIYYAVKKSRRARRPDAIRRRPSKRVIAAHERVPAGLWGGSVGGVWIPPPSNLPPQGTPKPQLVQRSVDTSTVVQRRKLYSYAVTHESVAMA
ncbi:hypothetical protein EVAR_43908_1 [Eumeta japonica]|uniref:Uncharacterized protein n=1 Tax=Eumeta variegata TaxID=151549 RepID=A0A4C1WRH5_EUMVA|nr:hypothetical protein EVAR_43908_1 [Eumeta japonica]